MLTGARLTQRGTLASLVFVRVHKVVSRYEDEDGIEPHGFVFIRNRKQFGPNATFGLISGHSEAGETAIAAGLREIYEETNLKPNPSDVREVGKWLERRPHGSHWKHLLVADIDEAELHWISNHAPGNEGEEPGFFTADTFYTLVRAGKFKREHYKKLVEYALLLPFGRDKPGRDS